MRENRTKYRREWAKSGFKGHASSLCKALKARAKQRKLEFNLTSPYLQALIIKQNFRCALTGDPIKLKDGTTSVDRIKSKKGYIRGNVRFTTHQANSAKFTGTDVQFLRFCRKVVAYAETKKK